MKVYIDHNILQHDMATLLATASEQRRRQAMRYRNEDDRKRSLAAYALLRRGLREMFGIDERPQLVYEPGGKPHVDGHAEVHFSLSHCHTAAMCVVSREPVGVDIETIRPYHDEVAAHVLNESELAAVRTAHNPAQAFIELWTRKEALLKLTGEGLRTELKDVLNDADNRYLLRTVVDSDHGIVYSTCLHRTALGE